MMEEEQIKTEIQHHGDNFSAQNLGPCFTVQSFGNHILQTRSFHSKALKGWVALGFFPHLRWNRKISETV